MKFVQINTQEDYERYFVPTFGGELDEILEDCKGAWWEITDEEAQELARFDPNICDLKEVLSEDEPRFIFIYGLENRLCLEDWNQYKEDMGYDDEDLVVEGGRYEYDSESGENVFIETETDEEASKINDTNDLYVYMSQFDVGDVYCEDYVIDWDGTTYYVDGNCVVCDGDGWTGDQSIAIFIQNLKDNFYKK